MTVHVAQSEGWFAGPVIDALAIRSEWENRASASEREERRGWTRFFVGAGGGRVFARWRASTDVERGQDMEFNQRLRRAGGKILLSPRIVSYYARTRLVEFARHNFSNGVWAVAPFALTDGVRVRWRHLMPMAMVAALAVAGVMDARAVAAMAGAYAIANVASSASVAIRRKKWSYVALLPVVFATLHFSYGLGSVWGALKALAIWSEEGRMNGTAEARKADFSTVTELPGQGATRVQIAMLRARYGWAASRARGVDVLEVACGAGLGLDWLKGVARSVEAGDLDAANCELAAVKKMDALELPFQDRSFDAVLLFEALYYLPRAGVFRRGRASAEARWPAADDHAESGVARIQCESHECQIFFGAELRQELELHGFQARISAAFPADRGWAPACVAMARKCAARFGWIPKTMAGKAWLKRVFYGSLETIPLALAPEPFRAGLLVDVERVRIEDWRVLYAEAIK